MNTVRRIKPEDRERVHGELLEMSGEIVNDPPLTADDKNHCRELVTKGFYYFDELGWTQEKETNFLARPSVRREIDRLMGIVQDADGLEQRNKFFMRLRMLQMLPAALSIVQMVLVGKSSGKSITELPTSDQYNAARDVIEWCGIGSSKGGVNVNVGVSVGTPVPQVDRRMLIGDDEDPKQRYDIVRVMQRTRVRDALDKIVKIAAKADTEIGAVEKLRSETKKKKKRRKWEERGERG